MGNSGRKSLAYLQDWLRSSKRQPMVIRGARQVGKTWTVRELAAVSDKKLIELNFEKNPNHRSLFASNDPQVIIRNLESHLNITIDLAQSILFLDEIQVMPELLSKLRWFAEEMPALPVVAAGSLLDFVLDDHNFSMPVGRITYLHMEPLSFEEFLAANNQLKLVDYLNNYSLKTKVPQAIHTQLMTVFKNYLVVGGMPAAVYAWEADHSIVAVNRIHNDLLATYRDDFSKYAGKINTNLLDDVLIAIPAMLGGKFVYSHINNNEKIHVLKPALKLLTQARLCSQIVSIAANGLPLAAESNWKFIKVIALDVGLVSAMLGFKFTDISGIDDINFINNGAISEQVVGQLLRCVGPLYQEPHLYYWQRQAKSSNAEIDYVIQSGMRIVPVEVKSGSAGSLKSLHNFMHLKKLSLALRINSDYPSVFPVKFKIQNKQDVSYTLLSLPFYLLEQVDRLIREAQ